nr:hypothetical protein HK105_000621 [Polyrhizophydium stewartii]
MGRRSRKPAKAAAAAAATAAAAAPAHEVDAASAPPAEPAVAEPAVAEPAVAEPAVTETAAAEPAAVTDADSLVAAFARLQVGGRSKALVRRNEYDFNPVPAVHIPIYSYNCVEWAFRKHTRTLPVLARGLFVRREPPATGAPEDSSPEWRIVARGYDKFFNVGEVPSTTWKFIAENTVGPYEVTLKENGCIIFVAAVDGHILVTSKHALGKSKDKTRFKPSHAEKGEEWLDEHLRRAGATREQLVAFLSEHNVTAVFELADDDFEEHILEYPPERRGLYLHGINENTPEFSTWDSSRITDFAKRFGFFLVECIMKDTSEEVRVFADECRKTGSYGDRPVEGFVVRCKRVIRPNNGDPERLVTHFFKIKYEEPYLMFREWREATLAVLAGRGEKLKPRHKLTKKYIAWVVEKRRTHPALFAEYVHMKGIIRARNMFLREVEGLDTIVGSHIMSLAHDVTGDAGLVRRSDDEGDGVPSSSTTARKASAAPVSGPIARAAQSGKGSDKTLLIPIATIGVGKSTVARALKLLFPTRMAHIQSDQIRAKKPGPLFVRTVVESLRDAELVFADRNNHLQMHREALSMAFRSLYPHGTIVAVDWQVEKHEPHELVRMTCDRVRERGENHLTLTPKRTPQYESIVNMFVRNRAPLDGSEPADSLIDAVIPVEINDPADVTLKRINNKGGDKPGNASAKPGSAAPKAAPARSQPAPAPAQESTGQASQVGQANQAGPAAKPKEVRQPLYFSAKISENLEALLAPAFASVADPSQAAFWNQLTSSGRVAAHGKRSWHVTLAYRGTSKYDEYLAAWSAQTASGGGSSAAPADTPVAYKLGTPLRVVVREVHWDSYAMAALVDRIEPAGWPVSNKHAHITIATASDDIKAVYSNTMLGNAMANPAASAGRRLVLDSELVLHATFEAVL